MFKNNPVVVAVVAVVFVNADIEIDIHVAYDAYVQWTHGTHDMKSVRTGLEKKSGMGIPYEQDFPIENVFGDEVVHQLTDTRHLCDHL